MRKTRAPRTTLERQLWQAATANLPPQPHRVTEGPVMTQEDYRDFGRKMAERRAAFLAKEREGRGE